jgi:hypothetical protein
LIKLNGREKSGKIYEDFILVPYTRLISLNRWMDGWMGRWINGHIDRQKNILIGSESLWIRELTTY